jgi:hypothetical protein
MQIHFLLGVVIVSWAMAATQVLAGTSRSDYFAIEVVDDQTGRGVPLVELKTVHGLRLVTDSNGLVAFHEPGLMDQNIFFYVASHGYEFPKDGFGYRGRALAVKPGGTAQLKIKRLNIAERLYRVTGAGTYRDTVLLGRKAPTAEPLINAQVTGSDSVVNAVYRGKIHWFWGDTNRPKYPLGNFHVPGAVSKLPADGGLDPERGVDLEYFENDEGFARPTAQMAGDGPTWIGGLTVVKDAEGNERMFASYVKIRDHLKVYRRGLARWDDEQNRFVHVADIPLDAPAYPYGHPHTHRDARGEFLYYGDPFPVVRVPAKAESVTDLSQYETFTCLKPASRLKNTKVTADQLDRDAQKRLRWAWKKDAPRLMPTEESRLLSAGLIQPDETRFQLRDDQSGKPVIMHAGSVAWNDYRKRWVLVAHQWGGTSFLGEVWYAEANALEGPWNNLRKIITHEKYSFYNVKQHSMLAKENGRVIFIEGTYTREFSGNPDTTPLYDYNQVMYKLDLSDKRLRVEGAGVGRRGFGSRSE